MLLKPSEDILAMYGRKKMMVNYEKPSLNELTHYGVKGMKWGVRKDRSKGGYHYYFQNQTKHIIKKGSTIHRITSNPNEKHEGSTYAAFTDADVKGRLVKQELKKFYLLLEQLLFL